MKPSSAKLFVVSGASGSGKTTLCRSVAHKLNLFFSVSATTRTPRNGEIEGQDYYFLSKEEFQTKISQGDFLEWAQVHQNLYGTLKHHVMKCLNSGQSVILDLDTQGALQLKKNLPEAVLIFIQTPSLETLRHRLEKRGTDQPQVIEQRMSRAKVEIKQSTHYDQVIVNEDLHQAIEGLTHFIQKQLGQA